MEFTDSSLRVRRELAVADGQDRSEYRDAAQDSERREHRREDMISFAPSHRPASS